MARLDRSIAFYSGINIGLLIAAAGWLLVAEAAMPGVRYGGLILVSAGSFCALAVFWTLCGSLLSQAAGPAGMALINCVGIAGGFGDHPVRRRRSEGLVRQLCAGRPVRGGDTAADDRARHAGGGAPTGHCGGARGKLIALGSAGPP